jgi:hypothetical protein
MLGCALVDWCTFFILISISPISIYIQVFTAFKVDVQKLNKSYKKVEIFKISQEELQDIQCFWLQDLEIDHPKLS